MSLSHAVTAGALLQFGGAFGSVLIGWLLDKRGIITIAVAFAVAAPLTIFIGSAHISDAVLMAAVFLTGIGMLGGQVGLNAISGTIYPTYIRSTGAGWAFGVGRIGSILGPVIGGVLIGWHRLPRCCLFTPRFHFCAVPELRICWVGLLSRIARKRRPPSQNPLYKESRTDRWFGKRLKSN